jgi:FkbM family methyltransferase
MISNYLIENKYVGVKRAKHGIFMFNRNDSFVGKSLDLYGEWCEAEILLLRNYIRESDVVLDIGANIGTHTVAFSAMVGSAGRVHAFEPQPSLFHFLCGNVALNCLDNVCVHRKAVGSGGGEIGLSKLPSPDTPFNFAAVPLSAPGDGEKVDLISVDSLGLAGCRLIKIDVEGMEEEVLKGAQRTVDTFQPLLFVENNTIERASSVIESIFRLSYRAYWHIRPYFNEYNFFGNTENVFSRIQPEANLLCVPRTSALDATDFMECTSTEDNWRKVYERIMKSRQGASPGP